MSIVNSTIEHVAATVVHVGSAAWRKSGDEVDSQRSFHTGNQCDRTPVHLFPHLDASTAEQRDGLETYYDYLSNKNIHVGVSAMYRDNLRKCIATFTSNYTLYLYYLRVSMLFVSEV